MRGWKLAVASTVLFFGCGTEKDLPNDPSASSDHAQSLDVQPDGKGGGLASLGPSREAIEAKPVQNRPSNNGIFYHGGPLLLGTTNVYYIWYGNWSGNSATSILTDLAQNIGGSPYYNINTTYYDGNNVHISNSVHYAGSTTDAYSQGTALGDSGVQAVVSSAISSGRLPKDTNAVYFVLTSADVNETSGFCTQYCGWHTYGTISGSNVKYAFIGNPDRCPSACEAQAVGPNGNAGADGMASIIAHELEEAATDPNLNAWYDRRGAENADKCAWTFGTTYTVNGALANMHLGNRDYLIQRNWVNASGGYCALSF
jgi:phosphate-induced protein 1